MPPLYPDPAFPASLNEPDPFDPARDHERLFHPHDPDLIPPVARVPYLVPGLLPDRTLVLLAAPPKSGKTALATALAWSVATGTPFAGRDVAQAPVVWLNFEESGLERRYALGGLPNPEGHKLTLGNLPPLDTPEGFDALDWYVRGHRPALVVIDSLAAAVQNDDMSRAALARRLMARLARLVDFFGVTIVVIHHTDARARRIAQSVQLGAATGVNALLTTEPRPHLTPKSAPKGEEGKGEVPRLLTLRMNGRGVGLDHTVRLVSEGPRTYRRAELADLYPPELSFTPVKKNERPDPNADRILALMAEVPAYAYSVNELVEEAERPYATVRHALDRLRERGRIETVPTEDATLRYRWREPDPAETPD